MTVRAFALDIRTYAVKHEIPYASLTCTNTLNGVGSWSMELPSSYTSPDGIEILTSENLDPNTTMIVITDDDRGVMMGLVESEDGSIDDSLETVKIGGREAALGYMQRRYWTVANQTYTNIEQFDIVGGILAKALPSGIGTTAGITATYEPFNSGILRTRTYSLTDRKQLYELIKEMCDNENGFDFTSYLQGSQTVGWKPGVAFGYPHLSRRTGYVLELGKNVKKISWARDGKKYANAVYVTGSKRGDSTMIAAAFNTVDLSTRPIMQVFENRSTVLEQTTLQSYANKYVRLYGVTPTYYDLTVDPGDPDSQIGSFRCGDEFRMIAHRGRLNVDSFYRLESWTLNADPDGNRDVRMRMFPAESLS